MSRLLIGLSTIVGGCVAVHVGTRLVFDGVDEALVVERPVFCDDCAGCIHPKACTAGAKEEEE